jgi:hypothetical protein
MSVPPDCLATSEGALISISIAVQPRNLESLLEALAEVAFPVNPGIFHDAAIVTRYSDGRKEIQSTTLVEFPAYEGRVDEVRRALERCGFGGDCIQVTAMLEDLQSDQHAEQVPAGAGYVSRHRVRCLR